MVQGSLSTQLGSAWQQSPHLQCLELTLEFGGAHRLSSNIWSSNKHIQTTPTERISGIHRRCTRSLSPRLAQSSQTLSRATHLCVKNNARLCLAPLLPSSSVAAPRVVHLPFRIERLQRLRLPRTQSIKMATNGTPDSFSPETILAAMTTMRGGEAGKKKAAMDYLSKFQKSVWRFSHHQPQSTYFDPIGD